MGLVRIRDETPADVAAIRAVHRRAFGRDAEADLVDALRQQDCLVVSLVAEANEHVAGHIAFSVLGVDGVSGVVALAPLAVEPQHQRRGIGLALGRHGIQRCKDLDLSSIIVLGDPHYYERLGFSAAVTQHLDSLYSGPHFMGLELRRNALASGSVVRYPDAFGAVA